VEVGDAPESTAATHLDGRRCRRCPVPEPTSDEVAEHAVRAQVHRVVPRSRPSSTRVPSLHQVRPPVCEICDADLDPTDGGGGSVTFQPDDRSIEWRRRAEEEGLVGHPPDTGWFCAAHIDAAREAALTRTYADGLRHLEAHARYIDVETLEFPDPVGLEGAVAVPSRSGDGLLRLFRDHRPKLVAALGGNEELRSSVGFRRDDVHDRSVHHATVGRFDVFDRVEYLRVEGELVAQLVEVRVRSGDSLLALVRVAPFDRLQTWVGDERLRSWVDAVAAELATPPADLLDPNPDLVGVDLGKGRLAASDGFQVTWVEWDLDDVDVHELARSFREVLPELFAALDLGEPPTLEAYTHRNWTPMDGAQPPYCPFDDNFVWSGTGVDGTTVRVDVEVVHWNEDDVHSARVSLAIGPHVSISAYGPNGGGRRLHTLWLSRPTTAAIVGIADMLAG
jgi:hypothetical protein